MSTILDRFHQLHPRSKELHTQAQQSFPDGVTHDVRHFTPFPLYVERAQGSHKWDVDGHEIIDCVMGHGALLLGHAHPAVVRAVAEQVQRGTHYGASHDLEVRWGEWVRRLIPSAEVVRFTNSGTEATMMAIRLARAFTGRDKLVRFAGHFHGWNDNVVGLPGLEEETPQAPGIPQATLSNVIVLPQNDPEPLRHALDSKEVAAVILEPTGASWGAVPLELFFLEAARQLTEQAGSVLIFDEVVTGFRVSPGGAQAAYGVTPDLTALAKILGGGLPGGAVAGRREIMSLIEFREDMGWNIRSRIAHPGTYNANPLSASAGSVTLAIVADGQPHQQADRLCKRLCQRLNELLRSMEVAGCAYGFASYFHTLLAEGCPEPREGFEWRWDGKPGARMPSMRGELVWALQRGMLNENVHLMRTGGLLSSAHTDADVDATIEAFRRTLAAMREEGLLT
ncbi:MAG: aspartate aminotransferase family protein [Dehalococcoidia bacterium]